MICLLLWTAFGLLSLAGNILALLGLREQIHTIDLNGQGYLRDYLLDVASSALRKGMGTILILILHPVWLWLNGVLSRTHVATGDGKLPPDSRLDLPVDHA